MIISGALPLNVQQAVDALCAGELVGLPTETVYGLAADACNETAVARKELADYRLITEVGPDALAERAEIVDTATAMLIDMLNRLAASTPTDAKGAELVPLWLADYRTYIADRNAYSQMLRSGINDAFAETMIDGLPLSEKIATFAADNYMVSCKPPRDLSV